MGSGEQATVRALDVDGVAAVALGTVLWGLALVACLALRDRLASDGRDWWIGVCLSGFALGLLGLGYVLRRRAAGRRSSSGSADPSGSESDSTSA